MPSRLAALRVILQCLSAAFEFVAVRVSSSQVGCILDAEFIVHPQVVARQLAVDYIR
jgi:hypothetical protein